MTGRAIKEFEVEEGSTENLWYRIRVFCRGKPVEEFLKPTMKEALDAFEAAGYERRCGQEIGTTRRQPKMYFFLSG